MLPDCSKFNTPEEVSAAVIELNKPKVLASKEKYVLLLNEAVSTLLQKKIQELARSQHEAEKHPAPERRSDTRRNERWKGPSKIQSMDRKTNKYVSATAKIEPIVEPTFQNFETLKDVSASPDLLDFCEKYGNALWLEVALADHKMATEVENAGLTVKHHIHDSVPNTDEVSTIRQSIKDILFDDYAPIVTVETVANVACCDSLRGLAGTIKSHIQYEEKQLNARYMALAEDVQNLNAVKMSIDRMTLDVKTDFEKCDKIREECCDDFNRFDVADKQRWDKWFDGMFYWKSPRTKVMDTAENFYTEKLEYLEAVLKNSLNSLHLANYALSNIKKPTSNEEPNPSPKESV